MGRKLFLLTVGAALVAYVVSRRRSQHTASPGPENGSSRASSHDVRRAVGAARQRIEAEAENR